MPLTLPTLHFWDIVLLAVVTLHATVHAYISDPKLKVFIYLMPFPFTAAVLAIGLPMDSTNIWSLLILASYTHCVRILYVKRRLSIYLAIGISLLGCVLLGSIFAPAIIYLKSVYSPSLVFWVSCAVIFAIGIAAHYWIPERDDPDQRTPTPLWLKIPTVAGVVFCLILLKSHFGGLITAFPMVGTVAAYEARHSLWTMSRQVTVLLPMLAVMVIAMHFAQDVFGLPTAWALVVSWIVYLPLITWCTPSLREYLLQRFLYSRRLATSSGK